MVIGNGLSIGPWTVRCRPANGSGRKRKPGELLFPCTDRATRSRCAAPVEKSAQFPEGLSLVLTTVQSAKDSISTTAGEWAQARRNGRTWATEATRIDKTGFFPLDRKFMEPISLTGI